jgi:hypothetical protein
MDDYGDLIPGETFDILVTCDLFVTAHDTDDRVYGDWQTVREPTCTENGLYYRESGEYRQYRTVMATGHQSDFNCVVDTPATCTSEGSGHTVCVKCQEQIPYTIPVAEHSYEYTTQVTANGSVVGKQIGECTECGHKTIREYISPIYPSGNIVVTFDQYHPNHSVTPSDRDEIHTMWKFTDAQGIERQAYLYQIQLDQFKNGYITGMDVTTWIFWADYGEHSPVYIARHNQTLPVYGGANNNVSWAVAGYADNLQEYIYLIDKLSVEVVKHDRIDAAHIDEYVDHLLGERIPFERHIRIFPAYLIGDSLTRTCHIVALVDVLACRAELGRPRDLLTVYDDVV